MTRLKYASLVVNNRPRDYKTLFMINLAEHEILTAHKY